MSTTFSCKCFNYKALRERALQVTLAVTEEPRERNVEKAKPGNYRRPKDVKDLKYWLENMIWHHRFTNEEITAATAWPEEKIEGAKRRYDIRPDSRPKRADDAPLLVLPYPGGRHPRIGFLEGAIDRMRIAMLWWMCRRRYGRMWG